MLRHSISTLPLRSPRCRCGCCCCAASAAQSMTLAPAVRAADARRGGTPPPARGNTPRRAGNMKARPIRVLELDRPECGGSATPSVRADKDVVPEDYVLAQPLLHAGPPKPVDPTACGFENEPPPRDGACRWWPISCSRPPTHFSLRAAPTAIRAWITNAPTPRWRPLPASTAEQAVRIYGFESGGNGKYDVQAGLEHPGPGAHAITTALGYNQLLATNSVELLAEKGDAFLRALRATAAGQEAATPGRRSSDTIAVLKSMVDFSRSVPDETGASTNSLREHPQGSRRARAESGYRRRSVAAGPEAARLRRVRARQGLRRAPRAPPSSR